MLTWIAPNVPNGVIITHYTVFYVPIRSVYDNKEKLERVDEEFTLNFTKSTGKLTNLNGSVTYKIQVSAIALSNGLQLIGNRSTAVIVTTTEGGMHGQALCSAC